MEYIRQFVYAFGPVILLHANVSSITLLENVKFALYVDSNGVAQQNHLDDKSS